MSAESAPVTRDLLALAEELEGDSERAYQRSCGAFRDEISYGQQLAYEDAAERLRATVAAVLAADPEPRAAVIERMARAMWADQYPIDHWDSTDAYERDTYRHLASVAYDATEGTA